MEGFGLVVDACSPIGHDCDAPDRDQVLGIDERVG
jgi:hypothetical protein